MTRIPRALITGASGFAGQCLARLLQEKGYEVWGTVYNSIAEEVIFTPSALDVRDAKATTELILRVRPDEIYHLAALTRPTMNAVKGFYEVNLFGSLNVLEAARELALEQEVRVLLVGSAYAYGRVDQPVSEDEPLQPINHYGTSKAAADLAAHGYVLNGLHVVRARPFNHSGPGQPPVFALPSFVHQIVQIEQGLQDPVLYAGNLASVRDFTDVRDVVQAYHLMLRAGANGSVFNVARGEGTSIGDVLALLAELAPVEFDVQVELSRLRPTDIPSLVGNSDRLREATGWTPQRNLRDTLRDMLDHQRKHIRS